MNVKGDARTQSPTTKNCAPEFPTFGEIAGFNPAKCNAESPPERTARLITVSSVPGKLIFHSRPPCLYRGTITYCLMGMIYLCGYRLPLFGHSHNLGEIHKSNAVTI